MSANSPNHKLPRCEPRRCHGCGASIVAPTCLACNLEAGTLRDKVIGDTEDVPGQPTEAEIAKRAAAIRADWSETRWRDYAEPDVEMPAAIKDRHWKRGRIEK